MSSEAQNNTNDPDVVIIDDLSDFEDLEHELQANIIKIEPASEAEHEPVPIAKDPPNPVSHNSDSKLVRFVLANQ